MMQPRPPCFRRPVLALTVACLLALAGCAGGGFGSELSVEPKPQQISRPEVTTLRIPQEQPFNIALPQSSRKPGLNGRAEADAKATPTGSAEASASVTQSGTADGQFQLGHAFSNETSRQTDFRFRVSFRYEFEVAAEPELDLPDAEVGLRLYARDDRGRLLRDVVLVAHTTESGATRRGAAEDVDFTLTLAPNTAVNVFVAGRVGVNIREGRTASGVLRLNDLVIELTTQPAPAVRTAGDAQD